MSATGSLGMLSPQCGTTGPLLQGRQRAPSIFSARASSPLRIRGFSRSHPEPMAKFLATMYAVADPAKYEYVLEAIAKDLDFRARKGVADAIGQTRSADDTDAANAACKRVLTLLEDDQRHSVRASASYASGLVADHN